MGKENLFHKRKAKSNRELARVRATREPYKTVLIVCEGEKTEPNYFNALKSHLKINSANIQVTGDCGSSPINVVNYAEELYENSKINGDTYDKVFCVFDKDRHPTFLKAVKRIKEISPEKIFHAIKSVPCFEYWLLLHFTYSTKPYTSSQKKSMADNVIQDLKEHLPDYSKSNFSSFDLLLKNLGKAKKNSIRSLNAAVKNQTDMPSTKVHEVIIFLEDIKKS